MLDMKEASDNRSEEHTVAELVEFCLNGRDAKSDTWMSSGVGKYLGSDDYNASIQNKELLCQICDVRNQIVGLSYPFKE
eukprot:11647388-Heterocapsa_arctica.AAC.1